MVKTSAHGFGDWLWQRITAATMLLYTLVVGLRWATDAPLGAMGWRDWFTPLPFRLLTLLFLFALMYHAWLGVREVLMDYVRDKKLRAVLQALLTLTVIGYAGWGLTILWSI